MRDQLTTGKAAKVYRPASAASLSRFWRTKSTNTAETEGRPPATAARRTAPLQSFQGRLVEIDWT